MPRKSYVDIRAEEGLLTNYPQTLIRAVDRVYRAYEDGKVDAAHNILKALMNQLYPVAHDNVKRIIDHIDMAEAEYLMLVNLAIPVSHENTPLESLYDEVLSEGQAIFDMARLRVIALIFRQLGLDSLPHAGALKMGDWTPVRVMLERVIEMLWYIGGSEKNRKKYEELAKHTLKEIEAAFTMALREEVD